MKDGARVLQLVNVSSGLILILTALAKIVSALGTERILKISDPLLGIMYRQEFFCIGGLELLAGSLCLVKNRSRFCPFLVAWFATNFAMYRVGLVLIGSKEPCPCLGHLTDNLHFPAHTVDLMLKAVLAYLLIGGYAGIFYAWRQRFCAKQ